jgi:metal-dependent amidase/aminoacylase/carboxypeptidase family protein
MAVGGAAVKDGRQAAALAARSVLEGGATHGQPWTGRNPVHAAARICCFLCSRRSSMLR